MEYLYPGNGGARERLIERLAQDKGFDYELLQIRRRTEGPSSYQSSGQGGGV
jgi:hypothetical protein